MNDSQQRYAIFTETLKGSVNAPKCWRDIFGVDIPVGTIMRVVESSPDASTVLLADGGNVEVSYPLAVVSLFTAPTGLNLPEIYI